MNPAVLDLLECPNCSTPIVRRYCPQCGQKVGHVDPTLRDLLLDLAHEFLHVDSKIFCTIRLLLTRPGFLTREYFEGRRARYVSPIRLYLIFSVAYFGLTALVERPVFRSDEAVEVGALGAAFGLQMMTPEDANRLVADVQAHWIPRLMFVLVPISALLVQVVTRRSGKNYPQHLFFALHVHAALFALMMVTSLLELLDVNWVKSAVSLCRSAVLVVYSVIAFRVAYGGRWRLAIGRTALVLISYTLVIAAATVLSVLVFTARH